MSGVLKTQNQIKTLRSLLRQAPVFLLRYHIAIAFVFLQRWHQGSLFAISLLSVHWYGPPSAVIQQKRPAVMGMEDREFQSVPLASLYEIAIMALLVPFSHIAWYNESNHTAKRGHVTDEME